MRAVREVPWFQLVRSAPCFDCRCFPCICALHEEARDCACGGVVIASPGDPAPGVRAHQSEPRHAAWAERVYG